nr:hypothetical protein B0A51_00117 [Rachicladosporium sp. CCFEE 5018]
MADTRPTPQRSSKRSTQPRTSNTSEVVPSSSERAIEEERRRNNGSIPSYTDCMIRREGGALMFNGPLQFLRFPTELQLNVLTPILDRAIKSNASYDTETKRWTLNSFSATVAHAHTIKTLNPLSYNRSIRASILKVWFERITLTSDVVCRVTTITDPTGNTQVSRKTKIMDSLVRSRLFTANGQHVILLTAAPIGQLPSVLSYIRCFAKACASLKTMVVKVEVAGIRTVRALNRLTILGVFHLWLVGYKTFIARSGLEKVEVSLVLL